MRASGGGAQLRPCAQPDRAPRRVALAHLDAHDGDRGRRRARQGGADLCRIFLERSCEHDDRQPGGGEEGEGGKSKGHEPFPSFRRQPGATRFVPATGAVDLW